MAKTHARREASKDDLPEWFWEGPNVAADRGIRTLTIKQPWAWAIFHGGKDIENRSWATQVRGPVAIHAAATKPDPEDVERLRKTMKRKVPDELPTGVILGLVEIVDCVTNTSSPWAEKGQVHFVLKSPRPLEHPVPAKGGLGFWYYSAPVSTHEVRGARPVPYR